MTRDPTCRRVVFLVLLGILAGLPYGFFRQAVGRTLTVETSGTTIIFEGNVARARNVAIANGKRNALEKVVMELIPEDVVHDNYEIINQNIYQQHERFIDTYRILSERSKGNIYEATLESAVAGEKVRKTLVALGLLEEERRSEESAFRLKILGVSCPPCFRRLKEYLQDEMEGVEKVSLYAISPGRFTLDIVFRGDMETFRDILTSERFEDFRVDPEGMDEEVLGVLMVLTHSEDG